MEKHAWPYARLKGRVEILEQEVSVLQLLPDRVAAAESQIVQLRVEMRDGFSAIVERLGRHDQKFDALEGADGETRRYVRVLHEEVLTRLALLQEGQGRRNL